MQLLLYQINWPAILDLESVGTGPSSDPILLPFRGIFLCVLESDLFQDNFTMVILRFLWRGNWPVRCHVVGCKKTGVLRLLSCDSDMTHRSNIFIKKKNNNNTTNLKAVFCLLELLVYIQLLTWTRLSSNAKFGNAQFEPACIETPPVSFICLFCGRQVNLK